MFIYTDAGYSWRKYEKKKKKKGIICFVDSEKMVPNFKVLEVQEQEGLRQYNNIFELLAVIWALKNYAGKKKEIKIITDSTTIKSWFYDMELEGKTKLHLERFIQLQALKGKFSVCEIEWQPREKNLAGIFLEKYYKV